MIEEEPFIPTTYSFTSYSPDDDEIVYATGTVVTTGNTSNGYTEVEVTDNSIDSFIGNKYWIISSAQPGQFYDLYTDAGTTTAGIRVKISE